MESKDEYISCLASNFKQPIADFVYKLSQIPKVGLPLDDAPPKPIRS